MFSKEVNGGTCASIEGKFVAYLDGRAQPAERHAVEKHLSVCATCRARAEELRALWGALGDLPEISPSPSFDASLRTRIAAEPERRGFWHLMPSPRLAVAVVSLVAISVWLSSSPRVKQTPTSASNVSGSVQQASTDLDFGMIRDLPVLENYDVVSKFDALSELNVPPPATSDEVTPEAR
jgi:predicted anti-sigma-YlaC factor YlaD